MPSKKKGYKNKDKNNDKILKKKDYPNHLKFLNKDYISNTIITYYPILIPTDHQ